MSDTTKKTESPKGDGFKIPADSAWSKVWMGFAGLAVVGGGMSAAAYAADPKRFAFSYLTAFAWGLTIALGGLFFVILQHLTRANWSIVIRRGAEHIMIALPLFAILFIPVFLFRENLYPWLGAEAHNEAVVAKAAFLNLNRWAGSAVVYFAIWSVLAFLFLSWSKKQDETGDLSYLLKMRMLSAPAILLFALSLTFAAFDWLMSLEPEWFSTMFGVYIFAGAAVSVMALLNIIFFRLRASGLLKDAQVSIEHHHDLGKLQFGFTIFWAYVSFSQYMLIWYANIPEETVFFGHRQENGWGTVSIFIILGHFFFPFFLTLSREAKRKFTFALHFAAFWILFMHYVDLYWLVMPNFKGAGGHGEFHFEPLADLGTWLLVIGALFAVVFRSMLSTSLVPSRDPRIDRALHFENA